MLHSSIHVTLRWLSVCSFQDLKSRSSVWVADWRSLMEVCVCVLLYSVQSVVSLGVCGGDRWKKQLMNSDSHSWGCGSLTTQATWMELRLTGTWPLYYTHTVAVAHGMQVVSFDFSLFNNRFLKWTYLWFMTQLQFRAESQKSFQQVLNPV